MKQILRQHKKLSAPFKIIIGSILLCIIISIFLCIRFVKVPREEVTEFSYSKEMQPPVCLQQGGFYHEAFIVRLTANSTERIYYSLDGTEPGPASLLYSGKIIIQPKTDADNDLSAIPTSPRWLPPLENVFKGTVLRAIAVDQKNHRSRELVRTFFVDEAEKERYPFPVVAITVNRNDFFGYKHGIYVLGKSYGDKDNYIRKNIPLNLPWWEYPSNYLMRGADAERPVHIEFYEPAGALGFEANAGIRINGNATRGFAQKSLRICFREKYGQAQLSYELFPGYPVKQFNSFLLRNSGNDWDKTMFRDGLMQSLMKNGYIDVQADRPCVVFINGEYWGLHNIRERFDENYLGNKYHVATDSVTILELNGELSYGKKGEERAFKNLLDFVRKNDLGLQSNYEHVKKQIDIRSFSDFLISNIFYCNGDWPNNNVKFWRYKAGVNADSLFAKDGRWRWMLYDTDWGFGYNSQSTPESNLLNKVISTGSVGILFSGLIKNPEFKTYFLKRFGELLNTVFSTEHMLAEIDKMQKEMKPGIREHINRWRVIRSYDQWLENVDVLKDFAKKRPAIQARQLNEFFKVGTGQEIHVEN